MLTLPCTAPQSSVSSPIESTPDARAPSPPPPPSSPGAGSSSSPTTTSSKKHALPHLLSNPTRRPSIRKRIQSISRASSASLDKATSTLSNAAGSSFSFLRHGSSSGSGSGTTHSASPTSAGNVPSPSPSPGSGSGSTHVRGASTSSFASGRSSKSIKTTSSSSGQGRTRLNVLNIGPPRAFKHQLHLGPDTRTSDGPWDESRWRNVVEMRGIDTPVIDVIAGLPCTTSERSLVVVSHSAETTSSAASIPNLLSITTTSSSNDSSPPSSSLPSSSQIYNAMSTITSATTDVPSDDASADKNKTSKAAKRASLVKRKPVPPLYPEEASPLPTSPAATSPALTTYVLMPDPMPESTASKVSESAPTMKVSFDVKEPEGGKRDDSIVSSQERPLEKEEAENKADEAKSPTMVTVTQEAAPAHVCILRDTPPPALPPRRHTLAHMQARALGRGMGVMTPSRPAAVATPAPASEPKPKARPMPIIAFSPGSVSAISPTVTTTASEEVQTMVEDKKEGEGEVVADNSPRPSLSSLDSTVSSELTCGARSASSGSESGETEEPHTPTDERRVSTSSAHSMSMNIHTKTQLSEYSGGVVGDTNVTIVLPRSSQSYDSDLDEDEDEEGGGDAVTPTRPRPYPRERVRRVSKRPNPPMRRVETNEESVYVTADEATDVE